MATPQKPSRASIATPSPSDIFRHHYKSLSQSLTRTSLDDVVAISQSLYNKQYFNEKVLQEIISSDTSSKRKKDVLLAAIEEAVLADYGKLHELATVLIQFKKTSFISKKIINDYNRILKKAAKEALRKNTVNLTKAISISQNTFDIIVLACEQEDLISSDFKSDISNTSNGSRRVRCNQLVSYIKTLVDLQPTHLDTFLCVLIKTGETLGNVAKSVADDYGYILPKYEKFRKGGATSFISANDNVEEMVLHDGPGDCIIHVHESEFFANKSYNEKLLLVHTHIKEQGELNVTAAKGILYGPPRVGKTSLMKRLIGEKPPVFSPSTGIKHPVTVPIYKKSYCNSLLIDLEWKRLSPEEMLQTCLNFLSTSYIDSTNEQSPESAVLGQQTSTEEEDEDDEIQPKGSDVISEPIPSRIIDFIKNQDWQKVNQILKPGIENAILLQIIDVGGQPEFHDILPLLLTGPALYLLFFNLTQDLEKPYTYEYRHKDGSFSNTYISQLTTLQILHQILSSNALSSHDDDDSAAIIIGTFLDKLREKCIADEKDLQAEIKKVDNNLKSHMKGHAYFKKLLKQFSKPDMFFPVDNVNGTMEAEIEPLHEFVKRTLHNLKSSPLPTTWALFYYLLQDFPNQNNGREYCTLDEARELAKDLQIDNIIEDVLKYIHDQFGSVLYYDDVCDDKGVKYVFCNPNVILKLVNKLVAICFGSNQDYKSVANDLRKTGVLTKEEFCKLCKSFSKDKSDPMLSYVIKLLKKCYIISHISNTHYFIPSLLEASNDTKYTPNPSDEVAPLLLRFSKHEETIIPPGLFSCMLVRLSIMEGWNLDGSERYKNKVIFLCKKSAVTVSVALIAQPHWIEVQLLDAKQSSPALSIWKDIHKVINKIRGSDTLLAKVLKSVDDEVGFYCPKAKDDDIPHYAAKKANDAEVMVCSTCEKDRSIPYILEKKHKIWFNDQYHNCELTATSSQTRQSTTNNKMSSRSIFQRHFAHLTQAITPILNGVSVGLFAEGLIPQATVNEMQTVGLTDDYKSSKLMTVLMTQLNASFNPDNYLISICKVFINQNHQQLTDIANSILIQLEYPVPYQGASNQQSESTATTSTQVIQTLSIPLAQNFDHVEQTETNNEGSYCVLL